MFADALTIEERTRIAVEIANDEVIIMPKDLAMHLRHVRIDQLRLGGPAAAHQQRLRVQRENASLIQVRPEPIDVCS